MECRARSCQYTGRDLSCVLIVFSIPTSQLRPTLYFPDPPRGSRVYPRGRDVGGALLLTARLRLYISAFLNF